MKRRSPIQLSTLSCLLTFLLVPLQGLLAQQDKVTAFKQSLGINQKRLSQYQWIETTIISMKGEEKSRIRKQCFYGPDGKAQKQQISASPQKEAPGGLRGRAVAKKKAFSVHVSFRTEPSFVVYTTNRLSRVTTLFTRLCRPLEGFPRSEL